MTHTYTNLLFHFVWSTKSRKPLIHADIKHRLYAYMGAIIADKKGNLIIINGMPDHVHLLLGLHPSVAVADFIGHLKSSSRKWIRNEISHCKDFEWQEGYGAYTVGYSNLESVKKYIQNQESHHNKMSYDEEFIEFLNKQNISFDKRFVLG